MSAPKQVKPFAISKRVVFEAWGKVKANGGAAGVDGQSIAEFEMDLQSNLYRVWNRMSSGTYFPPAVRAVEIPKATGGVRVLGVPTVTDRVAQTVVRSYLEPLVEPLFHPDSYGYRPGRSALDAVGACRERCWKSDWVIDLDIRAFFDSLNHDLVMRTVAKHTDLPWVLLYVQRWLVAPLKHVDGTVSARAQGTPQGSAISPLLANLFLHYAFDRWLAREFPVVSFERYADDAVIHCVSKSQAVLVLSRLKKRMGQVGLELHPDKTRIVYCKDVNRSGSHDHEQFNFLGYAFRSRIVSGKQGLFVSFSPAISDPAAKTMRGKIKAWRLHNRSESSIGHLSLMINPIVTGWITYYGRFHRSKLFPSLQNINKYLMRWAMKKYKRFRNRPTAARAWLRTISVRQPGLFAHWRLGLTP